jgi:hypothetical protein
MMLPWLREGLCVFEIRDQHIHSSGQARPVGHGAELLPLSPATSFTRSTIWTTDQWA